MDAKKIKTIDLLCDIIDSNDDINEIIAFRTIIFSKYGNEYMEYLDKQLIKKGIFHSSKDKIISSLNKK